MPKNGFVPCTWYCVKYEASPKIPLSSGACMNSLLKPLVNLVRHEDRKTVQYQRALGVGLDVLFFCPAAFCTSGRWGGGARRLLNLVAAVRRDRVSSVWVMAIASRQL